MQTVTLPAHYVTICSQQRKASSCGFERIDTTNPAARKALTHAIAQQLRNSFSRTYRWAADGTTFVLYYSDGWCYDIIGKAHAACGCPCTTMLGGDDGIHYHLALQVMNRHAINYCGADTTPAAMQRAPRRVVA